MVEKWKSGRPVELPPEPGAEGAAAPGRKRRRRRRRKGESPEGGTTPPPTPGPESAG